MHGSILMAFTFLLVVVIFAVVLPDISWTQALTRLREKLNTVHWSHVSIQHLDVIAILSLLLGQIWYLNRAQNMERLTLSAEGIRYTSPLPSSLKRLKPDWSIPWNQIQKAELELNGKLHTFNLVLLTFTSASDKRRIFVSHWINPETYSHASPRSWFTLKSTTQQRDEILKLAMESEVVRYLSTNASHIPINSNLSQAKTYTSLDKDPHGRIAMGIIFLLIAYAAVDFVIGSESYIDDPSSPVAHLP